MPYNPKTNNSWRIAYVNESLKFVQGSWDTRDEAYQAKFKIGSTIDPEFMGDSNYRVVEVTEIVNPLLSVDNGFFS